MLQVCLGSHSSASFSMWTFALSRNQEHKPAQSSTDHALASNGQANWPDRDLLSDLTEPQITLDLPSCC